MYSATRPLIPFLLLWALPALAQPYYFLQMSDPQFGMYTDNKGFEQETANFEFAIANANRLKPAFLVITGDLVNKAGDSQQIAELQRISAKLDKSIPLYRVAGNHDVGNEPTPESLAAYRERLGKDYYTFRSHDLLGIVLNGSLIQHPDKAAHEAEKQEKWLRDELGRARQQADVRYRVIFIHQSFFLEKPDEADQYFNIPLETRKRYLAMFKEFGVDHIFAGHYHRNSFGKDGALEMITTGPVGKALGPDGSGFRAIMVRDGEIKSHYFGLGFIPNVLTPEVF